MRIFFDTNVLISASLNPGLCFDLVNLIKAKGSPHHFLTSKIVLNEFGDKLKHRFKFSPQDFKTAMDMIDEQEIAPTPPNPSSIPVRDPDDALVLASALEAKADILVTGDQDLLVLSDKAGIKIVDPRTLWDMLEKEGI